MSQQLLVETRLAMQHPSTTNNAPREQRPPDQQECLPAEPLYSSWIGPGEGHLLLAQANTQLVDHSKGIEYMVQARTHALQERSRGLERANQHIQDDMECKLQFLTNISHELRTPLNAIIGFAEVLQEKAYGELNRQQEEYIHYILTSGNHLLSLVNDLLDLAKVKAGKMELQPEVCALRPLLEGSLI